MDTATPRPLRWELYRALSEPVRLRLLALVAAEELSVGELAELLGESQPNVSRHLTPLKQCGALTVRKQGTRVLVRAAQACRTDPVLTDATESGRELARDDGSLSRIAGVLVARESAAREYFAQKRATEDVGALPAEQSIYLRALATLLPSRALCIDAGTGEGSLLDVIAPVFHRVVAMDREPAQLEVARARARNRGYDNVDFVHADVADPASRDKLAGTADVVFAVRLLHHASKPAELMARLATYCKPPTNHARGGAVLCLDYSRHEDEAMTSQGDVWLGFEPEELRSFAERAGFDTISVERAPAPARGPDRHLPWVCVAAYKAQLEDH